jgi:hypothetical protein
MSTSTLAPEARRNVALFSSFQTAGAVRKFTKKDAAGNTILVLQGVPVFRSGTFRDSMGTQHSWESLHMQQMVDNFNHLTSSGIMAGAPVRKGHSGFFSDGGTVMDGLIGWHTGLAVEDRLNTVDGQHYTYLLADYEIMDPEAIDKINRGLWKSLSSEVGTWVSNAEAEYWPVYQGVAYVDFPAVEGLKTFASANGVGSKFSIMSEENSVPDDVKPPLPPAPPAAAQPAGQHAAGQPVQPAAPAAPVHLFTVGGKQVSDFAAVQAHITALEEFKTGSITAGRKAFVSGLVSANKMLATNQADTEAWVLTLDDAQFEGYKKQWEGAPVLAPLGNHAAGTTNHDGTQPAGTDAQVPDEIAMGLETIAAFRTSGMTNEQIKMTPTYAKLVKAGKAPELS